MTAAMAIGVNSEEESGMDEGLEEEEGGGEVGPAETSNEEGFGIGEELRVGEGSTKVGDGGMEEGREEGLVSERES